MKKPSILQVVLGVRFLILFSLASTLVGCGGGTDKLADVRGQVILDGKPLTKGSVTTLPKQGRGATGKIDSEGWFTLSSGDLGRGATVGKHQVAVFVVEDVTGINPEAPRKLLIPRKYTVAEASGLVIDVEAGKSNEVVLQLSSQK